MDSAEEVPNNNLYPRKHGLSSWMKNNFERLGNASNFEQYGASPPQAGDSFLPDYHKVKHDNVEIKEHFLTTSAMESPIQRSSEEALSKRFLYDPQLSHSIDQSSTTLPVPSLSSLLLESLTDDTSSSTDTTPFVTPQGSPLIPRRILAESIHNSLAKELAAQNTRKWLYKGFVAENNDAKGQASVTKKVKKQIGNVSPKSPGIKCKVSNFDINAISPSSW